MKSIKTIAIAALLAVSAFTVVTFTACEKDKCKDVTCQNGGTCDDGNCACATGYEGTRCETLTRDKFVGTWNGTSECSGDTEPAKVKIVAGSSNTEVIATMDEDESMPLKGTVTSATTVDFAEQTFSDPQLPGFDVKVKGKATLTSANTMSFNLTISVLGQSETCTATLAK